MAHREVHEVGRPARTEDRLRGQARDHALERDEEKGQDEQVQEKPVEPDGPRAAERPDLGGRAAEHGARGGEPEPCEAEHLAAAQYHAQGAQTEADDEHHVDQEADQLERIDCPRVGCGEPAREQEAEHAAEAERAAGDREDAADPAGAEALARPATEPRAHAKAKARAGFSTRRRVSPASSTPLARSRGTTFTSRWW